MKKRQFKSVVWKEGKYYVAQCLEVDVSSFGSTQKDALEKLQDALGLYFENEPFPAKSSIQNPAIASVILSHA